MTAFTSATSMTAARGRGSSALPRRQKEGNGQTVSRFGSIRRYGSSTPGTVLAASIMHCRSSSGMGSQTVTRAITVPPDAQFRMIVDDPPRLSLARACVASIARPGPSSRVDLRRTLQPSVSGACFICPQNTTTSVVDPSPATTGVSGSSAGFAGPDFGVGQLLAGRWLFRVYRITASRIMRANQAS